MTVRAPGIVSLAFVAVTACFARGMPQPDPNWALIGYAKEGKAADVKQTLLEGADPQCAEESGVTALHWSAGLGHQAVVKVMLHVGASTAARDWRGATPLHWAALDGQAATARTLLDNGTSLAAVDRYKRTPLFYGLESGNVELCRLLLHRGAALEARDASGRTPLIVAVEEDNRPLVAMLLSAGARVAAGDSRGRSAVFHLRDDPRMARLLAAHGANLRASVDGWTVLHRAAGLGASHLAAYLLARGLPPARADRSGETPLHIACLADCECGAGEGHPVPHTAEVRAAYARRHGHLHGDRVAVARLLLDHGAPVNVKDRDGHTPLDLARQDPALSRLLTARGARRNRAGAR